MVIVSNHRLVTRRQCTATRADGQPCGMPPMADSEFCWAHDPANAEAAAEARRMGGFRRKREGTVAGAYEFGGLSNVHDIRRLIEIAVLYPLFRLPEQVETAVRRRMASESAEKVERAVRDAVRDVAALWYLFHIVNVCFQAETRLLWAHLLLLVHVVTAWTKGNLGPRSPVIEEQVRLYLRDLVIWTEAVTLIGEKRYQGYDVLLAEPRQALDDMRQFAEDQLVRFNDHLDYLTWKKRESGKRTPKLPKPIEWETLRDELKDEVSARVSLLLDVARAEACDMMGEDQRATAFRERHL